MSEETPRLRTAILQQLRTAFAQIVFSPHAISKVKEMGTLRFAQATTMSVNSR